MAPSTLSTLMSVVLLIFFAAGFASNCNGLPTNKKRSVKGLTRRTQLEGDLDTGIFTKTRAKRQVNKTTVKISVKILSKSGWFVGVKDNGDVEGFSNPNSQNVVLQLESVGTSLVRMYGKKVKKYIAMDYNGKVYSTSQPNTDSIFKHIFEVSGFQTFASATHLSQLNKPMYLALRANGQPKKGFRARKTHQSAQFLVIKLL